jgi:hypothetical protein
MPITINANSITLPSNDVVTDEGCVANFGIMFGDGPTVTIADTSSFGYPIRATRAWIQKNINVSIGEVTVADRPVTWKHNYTGIYCMHIMYRQASGSEVWVNYAVTKNGDMNIVGASPRTGGEDAHTESFHLMYVCDDVDASYQIRAWSTGERSAGHTSGFYTAANDTPTQWREAHSGGFSSNIFYRSQRPWGSDTMEGRLLDINIYRVSPL